MIWYEKIYDMIWYGCGSWKDSVILCVKHSLGVFLQRKCGLIMKKHADLWHMSRNWSLEMVHTTCHKFNFEFWQPPNIVQFDQEEWGMLTKRNPAASAASIGSITDGWWFPKRSWVLTHPSHLHKNQMNLSSQRSLDLCRMMTLI